MGHSDRNENAIMLTTQRTVKTVSKKVQGTMTTLSETGLEARLESGKESDYILPMP